MAEFKIEKSQEEISQTINLNELIGSDISSDEKLVTKIGQSIIDYMEKRVDDGLGYGRQKLKSPYSKEYASSLDLKAAGKSKSEVNMKLSGDMMASIDILEVNGAKIKIGIDDGSQAPKAYGHQTGFKGHPTLESSKNKREFFGVTKEEIKKYILDEFKDDIKAKRSTSTEETNKVINAVRGIRTLADFFGG